MAAVLHGTPLRVPQNRAESRRIFRGTLKSFAQRRSQIVGDCLQLKTDADVYNDKRDPAQPIQVPLDFSLDVAELQQPLRKVA